MDTKGPRPYDFMPGYPNLSPQKYMNVGYYKTLGDGSEFPDKVGVGDYGPSQGGEVYYNPYNPVSINQLDFSKDSQEVAKLKGVYTNNIPEWIIRLNHPGFKFDANDVGAPTLKAGPWVRN